MRMLATALSLLLGAPGAPGAPDALADGFGCDPAHVERAFNEPVNVEGPLSPREVEERELNQAPVEDSSASLALGLLTADWELFKDKMHPGDCIFAFKTGATSWQALRGRKGYILVRGGKLIDAFVTSRS
jgi:hypothetical protein